MNQLYIKNVSGGVFKIPFKLGTPYEIQKRVKGVIQNGKGASIPSDVAFYIDLERLDYHEKELREIKVIVKKVKVPKLGIKPEGRSIRSVKKPKSANIGKNMVTKDKTRKGDK